ncbi:MAG: glutamate ligase domain-containing protein, partial [Nitrospiria bacterium]
LVIDDYAHHPTEIQATLLAAKQGWDSEVTVVFQPHRYTRTRDCLEALAASFQEADHLILSDIYPAGEDPIPGIDGKRLYQAVLAHRHEKTHYLHDRSEIVASLRKIARPGMMILTLGAGDIWKVGEAFLRGED